MALNLRDPANELYDQACSLLAAAKGLRVAARSRLTAPALAASLGCIEASLQQLREAMPELLDTALATAARDQPNRRTHPGDPTELCASSRCSRVISRIAARAAPPYEGWLDRW